MSGWLFGAGSGEKGSGMKCLFCGSEVVFGIKPIGLATLVWRCKDCKGQAYQDAEGRWYDAPTVRGYFDMDVPGGCLLVGQEVSEEVRG